MFQCTEFTEDDVERLVRAVNAVAAAPIPTPEVAERFRRAWPKLRDEITDIDLDGAEDPDEEEAVDQETVDEWLHEIEEKILATVAWSGDTIALTAMRIAQEIKENHVVTQHHIDKLVGRGFLHERLSTARPPNYIVTQRGRTHAVEEDLI